MDTIPPYLRGYYAYMSSTQWATKRAEMIALGRQRCQNCNIHNSERPIQIHHWTTDYSWFNDKANWGTEIPFQEVSPMCVLCHEVLTARRKAERYDEKRSYTTPVAKNDQRELVERPVYDSSISYTKDSQPDSIFIAKNERRTLDPRSKPT